MFVLEGMYNNMHVLLSRLLVNVYMFQSDVGSISTKCME